MSLRNAETIISQAMQAADQPYREALALEIQGQPGGRWWAQVYEVLYRAYVLLALNGIADAARQASLSGCLLEMGERDIFEEEDEPIETMFAAGPFEEAICEFEGRVPQLRSQVSGIIRRAQDAAEGVITAEQQEAVSALSRASIVQKAMRGVFYATDVDEPQTINLMGLIAEAIRGDLTEVEAGRLLGVGLSQFIQRSELMGVVQLSKARLQTIYRTNLSSAYSFAHSTQLADPEVKRFIPLMILSEIKDRRTRGNPTGLYPHGGYHWQMDGFVGTTEDFNELGILPPNGYNCRAGVRGVPRVEAKRRGWLTESGDVDRAAIQQHNGDRLAIVARGDYPDPGFLSI